MAINVMTWVWDCSRSKNGARLVLLAIADNASSDGGQAWPSKKELMRKAALGESAVQDAIKNLVALGELEVRTNGGPGGCNMYRVIMGETRPVTDGKGRRSDPPPDFTPPRISPPPEIRTPAVSAPPRNPVGPPRNAHGSPPECT